MANTYYVNAATGSDTNAGTSASAALQSITALENIKLLPGDTVLFARGTSYSEQLTISNSGTVGSPITFGAYGTGDPPLLTGAGHGIVGSKTQNIVVQDLAISNTSGDAIFAHGAANWTVQNITVSHAGSAVQSGTIGFEGGSNITIKDSTITGGTGDGIWIDGVNGITISQNHIGTMQGHDADNVQVVKSTGVSILGNTLDMSGQTDSTKGNLVVNHSNTVVIEHNTLIGGSYGASVNSDNVIIASNEIFGQGGYSWSFGIGIGEKWSVKNYDIHDNYVHDVRYGVAITGSGLLPVTRTEIDVHNNTFDDITGGTALKVDRPASGDFTNNAIGVDSVPVKMSDDDIASGAFVIGTNTSFVPTSPDANVDLGYATKVATHVDGNLLANDTSAAGTTLNVTEFGGKAVGDSLEIDGEYGSIFVNHDGSFVYLVNQGVMQTVSRQVSDVFTYLISDGDQQSASTLTINLQARVNFKPVAVDDTATTDSSGLASGNILANDYDNNGDTIHLRTVGATKIAPVPLDIVGNFGTQTISANGDFSYQVDPTKVHAGEGVVHDTFNYKISDSSLQDAGSLNIYTDTQTLVFDPGLHG